MFPWAYIISTTARAIIQSLFNPTTMDLPPFTNVDNFNGQLTIVQETGDPNSPTAPYNIAAASVSLILEDGVTEILGAIVGIIGNVIQFSMNILEADILPQNATLQVIITTQGQSDNICILNQSVVIQGASEVVPAT